MILSKGPQLKKVMNDAGCEALLITGMENVRYMTGFTGSSGLLLFTGEGGIFFTDSRYTEQAASEVKGFEVRECRSRIRDVSSEIADLSIKSLGFEDGNLTYHTYREFRRHLKGIRLIPLGTRLSLLRAVKTREEIRLISKAIDIATGALDALIPSVKTGRREDDLAVELEYLMRRGGAEGLSFDVIVASGARSALPHGRPGDKRIRRGDPVVIDFGAKYRGYHSDETVTLFVGRPLKKLTEIYRIVKDAHDEAIDAVRPGVKISDIDKAARNVIEKAGFGKFFGHGTGHGTGLNVHEGPAVNSEAKGVILEGMVFTVEPGIYIPDLGGVRIEDMVHVKKNGCTIMTRFSKELKVI